MKKKIKIFLGGYPNFLNAQNINCRALSEHLDKNRFQVSTMLFPFQNANDFERVEGVEYIRLRRPVRLWQRIGYLRGIAKADVAYLPKQELNDFCFAVAKLFGTKLFTTLEGLIDDSFVNRVYPTIEERNHYIDGFRKFEPRLYSITKFLASDVSNRRGYHFADKVLYLGVEQKKFMNPNKQSDGLKNIVFIGNLPIGKKVDEFMYVASFCPDIKFHIVGGNQLANCTVEEFIDREKLTNVIYHGRLDHSKLSALLAEMDLMYFPSRSEGFPKVHLETACAGVPTLCYGDYGAAEWFKSGVNGIIVDNKEQALVAINELKANPAKLKQLSDNAIELGKSFDWGCLVGAWETEIEKMYNQ